MPGFERVVTPQERIHITEEAFMQQFKADHVLLVEGNEPTLYTMVVPEALTSDKWVIYVGGLALGKEAYLDEIKKLAESGRKILYTNPTKGIVAKEGEESAVAVPDTIQNKSRALGALLKEIEANSVDFVGHSQGAAVITAFVAENPGVASKLILECPAGLSGDDDSGAKLMGRFVLDKANTIIKAPGQLLGEAGLRASKSFQKNIKSDFKFRMSAEIEGAARVNIAPLLKEIKQRNETEIVLINANDDKVFTSVRIEETLGEDQLTEYVDRWIMYAYKTASHSAPSVSRSGLLTQVLHQNNE